MIAVYSRVSAPRQDRRDERGNRDKAGSLEQQIEFGIKFAEGLGEPYEIYVEQGSGKSTEGRHDFQRLLKDIEVGHINKVWTRYIDRSSRDVHDGTGFIKELEKYGVRLFEGDNGNEFDLSDADDVMRVQLGYVFAERERKKIVERVRKSKKATKNAGRRVFCYVYGYAFGNHDPITGRKIIVIDEKEAEIVKLIYDLYLKGMSFIQITRHLNEHGYKPKKYGWIVKKGKDAGRTLRPMFDQQTISKILHRPEYIGLTPDGSKKLIKSVYPPILTSEEQVSNWYEIQKTIQDKTSARVQKHFKEAGNLITGLIRCPFCGASYFYHKTSNKHGKKVEYSTYMHVSKTETQSKCENSPKNFVVEDIESIVKYVHSILIYTKSEYLKFAENQKSKILSGIQELSGAIARLEADLEEVGKQKRKLLSLILSGTFTDEETKETKNELDERETALKTSLEQRRREKTLLETQENEAIIKLQNEEQSYFDSLNVRAQRSLLGTRLTMTAHNGKLTISSILGSVFTLDVDRFKNKADSVKAMIRGKLEEDKHDKESLFFGMSLEAENLLVSSMFPFAYLERYGQGKTVDGREWLLVHGTEAIKNALPV